MNDIHHTHDAANGIVCSGCGASSSTDEGRRLLRNECREYQYVPPGLEERIDAELATIKAKLLKAMSDWPPMNSAHEGFGVLSEEVDELWDCVRLKQSKRDIPAMRGECHDVAAMAIRFALEVCNETVGRK